MPTAWLMMWRMAIVAAAWWALIPAEIATTAIESELDDRGVAYE